jgi:hypothetical protein
MGYEWVMSCQRQQTVLAFIAMGASIALILALQTVGPAAQLPSGMVLHATWEVSKTLAQSLQDLAAMPRTNLTAGEREGHALSLLQDPQTERL